MATDRRPRTDLRETARELAAILWREHTVYRERGGTLVVRSESAGRWISLTSAGTDAVRVRAGRVLDGGTTAPARVEASVARGSDTGALAACCRSLLAEIPASADFAAGPVAAGRGAAGRERPARPARRKKDRRWLVTTAVVLLMALLVAAWYQQRAAWYGW
ncbi:hypothetical protein [Streptomyces boninensis]|uniref:hypothetical protein n=1 Tax=Streptomyces boninensis TaxID=2039455 RepID=UPI003B221744